MLTQQHQQQHQQHQQQLGQAMLDPLGIELPDNSELDAYISNVLQASSTQAAVATASSIDPQALIDFTQQYARVQQAQARAAELEIQRQKLAEQLQLSSNPVIAAAAASIANGGTISATQNMINAINSGPSVAGHSTNGGGHVKLGAQQAAVALGAARRAAAVPITPIKPVKSRQQQQQQSPPLNRAPTNHMHNSPLSPVSPQTTSLALAPDSLPHDLSAFLRSPDTANAQMQLAIEALLGGTSSSSTMGTHNIKVPVLQSLLPSNLPGLDALSSSSASKPASPTETAGATFPSMMIPADGGLADLELLAALTTGTTSTSNGSTTDMTIDSLSTTSNHMMNNVDISFASVFNDLGMSQSPTNFSFGVQSSSISTVKSNESVDLYQQPLVTATATAATTSGAGAGAGAASPATSIMSSASSNKLGSFDDSANSKALAAAREIKSIPISHSHSQADRKASNARRMKAAAAANSATAAGILDGSAMMMVEDIKPVEGRKQAHNAIERRYRNNINDRIKDLKEAVPALNYQSLGSEFTSVIQSATNSMNGNGSGGRRGRKRRATATNNNGEFEDNDDDDDEDGEGDFKLPNGMEIIVDGVALTKRGSKAAILRKATEYIYFLRKELELKRRENAAYISIIQSNAGIINGNGINGNGPFNLEKLQNEISQLPSEIPSWPRPDDIQLMPQQSSAPPAKRSRGSAGKAVVNNTTAASASASAPPQPVMLSTGLHSPSATSTGSISDSGSSSPTYGNVGTAIPRLLMAVFMGVSFFGIASLQGSNSHQPVASAHVSSGNHDHSAVVLDSSTASMPHIPRTHVFGMPPTLLIITFVLCLLGSLALDGALGFLGSFKHITKLFNVSIYIPARRTLQTSDVELSERYAAVQSLLWNQHGHRNPGSPFIALIMSLWTLIRMAFGRCIDPVLSLIAPTRPARPVGGRTAKKRSTVNGRAGLLLQLSELELLEPPTLKSMLLRTRTMTSLMVCSQSDALMRPLLQRTRMVLALHINAALSKSPLSVFVTSKMCSSLVSRIMGRTLSANPGLSTPAPEIRPLVQLATALRADMSQLEQYADVVSDSALHRRIGRPGAPIFSMADIAGLHNLQNALRAFITGEHERTVPEIVAAGSLSYGSASALIRWCGIAAAAIIAHCRGVRTVSASNEKTRNELATATLMLAALPGLSDRSPVRYISLVVAAANAASRNDLAQANSILERAVPARMQPDGDSEDDSTNSTDSQDGDASQSDKDSIISTFTESMIPDGARSTDADAVAVSAVARCLDFMACNLALETRWNIWRAVRTVEALEDAEDDDETDIDTSDEGSTLKADDVVPSASAELEASSAQHGENASNVEDISSATCTIQVFTQPLSKDPTIVAAAYVAASSRNLRAQIVDQLMVMRRMSPADFGVSDTQNVQLYGALYQRYLDVATSAN